MVSLSKASSILFAASSISSHVANAHLMPKDFDAAEFAVRLKKFRADAKIKEATNKAIGKVRGAQVKATSEQSRIGNPEPGGTTPETFLDGHEFIPPQEGDSRGPCPYINCMANHGFINRSGQDVPAFDIPILAMTLFDLPDTMFPPVVNMAIFDGQVDVLEDGQVLLDIERLWNRPGEERDVSQVFPNPGLNFNEFNLNITVEDGFAPNNEETFINFRYEVDRDLLKQLTDRSSFGRLTIFDHQQHLRTRILDSLDPNGPLHDIFFVFSEESMAVAANQYLFPVMLLGDMVDDFSSIELDVIEDFWTQFRLPEGFAPRSIRFPDTFDFVAFNQARQDWQDENVLIALNAFEQGKSIVKHGEEEEEPPTSSDAKIATA